MFRRLSLAVLVLIIGLLVAVQGGSPSHASSPARWEYADLNYFVDTTSFELDQNVYVTGGLRTKILLDFGDGKFKTGNKNSYGAAFATMGRDGWEMVAITLDRSNLGTSTRYMFKRPLL